MRYTLLLLLLSSQLLARTKPDEEVLPIKINGKIGFINLKGKVVIEPQFKAVGHFVDGLAPARKGGTYGYIDKTGKFVIPDVYDYAKDFKDGIGIVYLDARPLLVNKFGKSPIAFKYRVVDQVGEGFVIIKTDQNKFGVINKSGKLLIDTLYAKIENYNEGIFIATLDDHGWRQLGIDTLGNILFNSSALGIGSFNSEFAVRKVFSGNIERKIGIVNKSGQEKIVSDVNWIRRTFSEGVLICEQTSDKYPWCITMIDSTGKRLIENSTYTEISDCRFGKVIASNRAGSVLLNRNGKVLKKLSLPPLELRPFAIRSPKYSNGLFIIHSDSGDCLLDSSYNIVLSPRHSRLFFTPNKNYLFELHGNLGILNIATLEELPTNFDFVNEIYSSDAAILVSKGNMFAYVTYDGKEIKRWVDLSDVTTEVRDITCLDNIYYTQVDTSFNFYYPSDNADYGREVFGSQQYGDGVTIRVNNDDTLVYSRLNSDSARSKNKGLRIIISNNSQATLSANDDLSFQALNTNNNWVNLEAYSPFSTGGSRIWIPKNCAVMFAGPLYTGSYRTKLRLCLKINEETGWKPVYSNEFEGSINPGQLWRKKNSRFEIFNE